MSAGRVRLSLGIVLTVALFVGLRPVTAQGTGCDGANWARLNETEIPVWYLSGDEAAARAIADMAVPAALHFQPRVYEIFGLTSSSQMFLRIYPSDDVYRCFNPFGPAFPLQPIFGLRGGELGVVMGRLGQSPTDLEQTISDSLTAALLQTATSEVAGDYIPDVLMSGIGGYGLRPGTVAAALSAGGASEELSLVQLLALEGKDVIDTDTQVQATLLISYLVGAHGWEQFRIFLDRLEAEDSPLSAFRGVYGNQTQAIEAGWDDYRRDILNGDAGHHLIYGIDLSPIEAKIDAGSYGEAIASLTEVMPFIRLFESAPLPRAVGLVDRAETGLEAIGLLNKARETLLEGQYLQALNYAEQAERLFSNLGNDERAEESESFGAWATDVLSLRAEAAYWSGRRGLWSLVAIPRLISVRDHLADLGDSAGAEVAGTALNENYRSQIFVMRLGQVVLALICLLMLPKAISGLGSRKPKEARLF